MTSSNLLQLLLFCVCALVTTTAPVSDTFTHFNPEHNPNPPVQCRSNSSSGICMFSFECIQSRGHAIGLCVQGLFVGTCCIVRKGTSMHLPSYDNMTNTSGHNSLLTTSTALPATIEHAASVASSHSIKAARFETQSIDSLQTHSYDVIYATVMESSTVASVDSTTSPLIDQTKLVQVELISLPNATADTKDSTSADAKQTNANSSINLSNDISDVKYQVIALHQTESFSKSDSSTTSTIASSSPTTWVKNDDLLTSTTHSQAAKSEAETTLSNDLHSKTRIDYISTTSGLNVTLQTIASESVPTNTPYSLLSSNQTDSNVAHSPPDSLTTAGVLPSNTSRNEYDFSLVSQNEKYTFVTTTSTVEMTTRAHSHYAESSTNTESSSEQPITSSSISSNSTEPTIDLASKLSESSSNQVTMPAYVSATPASTEIVQSTHANIIENTFSPIDQVSTMKYESVSISMTTTTTPASLFHPKKDCGHRPLRSRARVVGGRNAQFGEWPWQVLVKEATWLGLFVKTKCGGVLIDTKWVLTAAHCQPAFLGSLLVIVGEYDLGADGENLKPVARPVKRMIIHRNYNAHTFENDIALLELESPLGIQPHVLPICLPEPDEQFVGRMAFVAGWGKLTYGGAVPSVLQVVRLPVLDNAICQQMFFAAGHIKKIRDTFLCAGYKTGGMDSCEGDSGGPLMSQRDNGQWVLLGTVSHGIKCAEPNLPGVYMRTSAYRKWIDNVLRNSAFRNPTRSNYTTNVSTVNKIISLSAALSATTSRPERMARPDRQPKFSFRDQIR